MISDAQKIFLSDLGNYLIAASKLEKGVEVPVDVSDNPNWEQIDKICSETLEIGKYIARENVNTGFAIISYISE